MATANMNPMDRRSRPSTVSYMAQHTLGRRIKDGASPVRIYGEEYDVKAEVASIEGYSAHADRNQLLRWAGTFDDQRLGNIYLVHGEEEAANALAKGLDAQMQAEVTVPARGQEFSL